MHEWLDDAEHLLEQRHYLWLENAWTEAEARLTERPDSRVSLSHRRVLSEGCTEVSVLVNSSPDPSGHPA